MATLRGTNFEFSVQTGEVYRGKSADTYSIDNGAGELLVAVRTDRISAFDQVLPDAIEHKGQVLNQMSANLLRGSEGVVPNWLLDGPDGTPDPNVSLGYRAQPFKIEMIMRAYLLGSAWKAYEQEGMRQLGEETLAEGMREFDPFQGHQVLITPTTKAEEGHDENITPEQIVEQGLATDDEYNRIAVMAIKLFAHGARRARQQGLTLADTKYEFGKLPDGKIVVIDEIHTPDSSRYFPTAQLMTYQQKPVEAERPEQMSKEFVREWLKANGFQGEPGQEVPRMSEEFRGEVSDKYIDLYRRVTGERFEPAVEQTESDIIERIRENIVRSLQNLAA